MKRGPPSTGLGKGKLSDNPYVYFSLKGMKSEQSIDIITKASDDCEKWVAALRNIVGAARTAWSTTASFTVDGAGTAGVDGVYTFEGRTKNNAMVYCNVAGFSMSREQVSGEAGWILGQDAIPLYGSPEKSLFPPTGDGSWQCFKGLPPAPTIKEVVADGAPTETFPKSPSQETDSAGSTLLPTDKDNASKDQRLRSSIASSVGDSSCAFDIESDDDEDGSIRGDLSIEAEAKGVPVILVLLTRLVRKLNGFSSEGIFRKASDAKASELAREASRYADYEALVKTVDSAHTAADMLKYLLRRLREPLIPFVLYDEAIAAGKGKDPEAVSAVVKKLEGPSRDALMYLCNFLKQLCEHEKVTRMNASNLAIVFAPNIIRKEDAGKKSSRLSSADAMAAASIEIEAMDHKRAFIETLIKTD